jgi:hypothetical protein
MKKSFLTLCLLGITSAWADKVAVQARVVGLGFRDDGAAFVRLLSNHPDSQGALNSCVDQWIYVPDSKTMSIFLAAHSNSISSLRVSFNSGIGPYVFHNVVNCNCQLRSVVME